MRRRTIAIYAPDEATATVLNAVFAAYGLDHHPTPRTLSQKTHDGGYFTIPDFSPVVVVIRIVHVPFFEV